MTIIVTDYTDNQAALPIHVSMDKETWQALMKELDALSANPIPVSCPVLLQLKHRLTVPFTIDDFVREANRRNLKYPN